MFLPPGRDSPIQSKYLLNEWIFYFNLFIRGEDSLTKSILTLIAQIHLENTKEDTGQSKFLRTQQLALIISKMTKDEKARGKERGQF